ncbi:urease accessory protein UreD [Terrarubrum flagellatum]|uniref:urease accessory protein UreD n=1 Tax=Terrirubrum flagellatum TaxID=2895980 RepID=UPI00314506B4
MSEDLPDYLRARGAISLSCAPSERRTIAARVRQEGALNIRFPRHSSRGLEGVIVNIAGGVAAGDRHAIDIHAGRGANATITTPAAEKVYRSPGGVSRIEVALSVEGDLAWLPQETILFDQARLARRLHATLSEEASLLACDITVLGRAAMGERVRSGFLRDEWRVRRGGRLIYADTLLLDGDIEATLARPGAAAGASAFATILYVAPDAEARLDETRALLDPLRSQACDVAASAWDGLLALRWLAQDARLLRASVARFLESFRGAALPRVWMT